MTIYFRVYALLEDGKPRACADIARELDCHHTGVSEALKQMRKEGEAYVSGWIQKATGAPCAQWKIGAGENVPRPAVMTKTERRAKNLKLKRQAAQRKARKEWTQRVSAIKPFRDPLVVALFGEYVRAEA